MLETLRHEATKPAIGSVIWLHGLAASGDDLPVAPMMKLPDKLCFHMLPFDASRLMGVCRAVRGMTSSPWSIHRS